MGPDILKADSISSTVRSLAVSKLPSRKLCIICRRSGSTFEIIIGLSFLSSRLNLDEVEPGATKLAPIGVAPKDAQKPIEDAMRWADSVRAAIGAESSHFLTVAGLGENSELPPGCLSVLGDCDVGQPIMAA